MTKRLFAITALAALALASSAAAQSSAFYAATPSLGTDLVVASSHKVVSFEVNADSTLNAGAWFLLMFDATSDPGNGAVAPAKCYSVPSGTAQMSGTFAPNGIWFQKGIVLVVSTTGCFTETQSAHAFIAVDWQ